MALIYPCPLGRKNPQVQCETNDEACKDPETQDQESSESLEDWLRWSLLLMYACLTFPAPSIPRRIGCCRRIICLESLTLIVNIFVLAFVSIDAFTLILFWVANGGGINRGFYMAFQAVMAVLGNRLFLMARRWPKLINRWLDKESVFRMAPYRPPKRNYRVIFLGLTVLAVVIAFCDQALYVVWRYERARINFHICHLGKEEYASPLVHMYSRERPQFQLFVNFRPWMAPVIEIQYVVGAFYWTMSLMFIVILAMWITARFRQLQERIEREFRDESGQGWGEVYSHFKRMVDLVEDVNQELGLLILLTCIFCMSFVCYFVFKLIRQDESSFGTALFVVHLMFIFGLTLLFFWKTSEVNEVAEAVKLSLLQVRELEMYQGHIMYSKAIFTGKKLFSLTWKTLLTFSAAIVTYEVILGQSNYEGSLLDFCGSNSSRTSSIIAY